MKQTSLHVAIIMDGNGRWANLAGLPRLAGHHAGAQALRAIVEAAPSCAIDTLTVYAFSSDNWKRPAEEVNGLMELFAAHLNCETPRLLENGVRLSVIGRRDRLPRTLVETMESAEHATRNGQQLHLQLAVDYSAREAILESKLSKPVDLLIRTGGEQRLSDFLLWECAYAELVFTKRMWPEFDASELRRTVREFHRRDRRFGAIPPPAPALSGSDRWLR